MTLNEDCLGCDHMVVGFTYAVTTNAMSLIPAHGKVH
jgi:hypothetical protein